MGNVPAEIQYIETKFKESAKFNKIERFIKMIQKYENDKQSIQQISIIIGMEYFYNKNDIQNALENFSNAIKINSNSYQLKVCT